MAIDSGCFNPVMIVASWAASGAGEAIAVRPASKPASVSIDFVDIRPLLILQVELVVRR
jgi:hypothetical protein